MRIYLSGPMTGLPEFNFPAFNAEAARLRSLGYDVINPAELNPDQNASWHDCMRRDLIALLTCDAIVLMNGWQKSAGAHLEMHVAHRVGMEILTVTELNDKTTPAAGGANISGSRAPETRVAGGEQRAESSAGGKTVVEPPKPDQMPAKARSDERAAA